MRKNSDASQFIDPKQFIPLKTLTRVIINADRQSWKWFHSNVLWGELSKFLRKSAHSSSHSSAREAQTRMAAWHFQKTKGIHDRVHIQCKQQEAGQWKECLWLNSWSKITAPRRLHLDPSSWKQTRGFRTRRNHGVRASVSRLCRLQEFQPRRRKKEGGAGWEKKEKKKKTPRSTLPQSVHVHNSCWPGRESGYGDKCTDLIPQSSGVKHCNI